LPLIVLVTIVTDPATLWMPAPSNVVVLPLVVTFVSPTVPKKL